MNTTKKGKEVIAYKRIKINMRCMNYQCSDFQYEIGKTYKTELWKCRFHACLNPRDILGYYSQEEGSRYFKVKLSGEITKCNEFDTELAATEMTILEEIDIKEAIKTEWWKGENVIDLLYFNEGFAKVKRGDGKYNYIDRQGNILSKEWFECVGEFYEGFARVQRTNGEWAKIDKNGKIVTNQNNK